MSIELFPLFSVELEAVRPMLAAAERSHRRNDWALTAFSGFPTAMVFRPDEVHAGSMHYMFFPAAGRQRFHHHPGARCVVLLGDVDMHIHYSTATRDSDPEQSADTVVAPALTLTAVRFPPFFWHCFETCGRNGTGVLGLTFHDNDRVGVEQAPAVTDDLMEDRTVYWSSAA
jgi:hypothetical protein